MRRFIHLLVLALVACCALPLSASVVGRTQATISAESIAKAPPQKAEALNLPYEEHFNDSSFLKDYSQINTQAEYKWVWSQWSGVNYSGCAGLTQTSGLPCNNWLITPGFNLKAGMTYRLTFWHQNWFSSTVKAYLMTSTTDTTNVVELWALDGEEDGTETIEFEVQADGVYYIGWHDFTPYRHNDTALRYSFYIDDLTLQVLSNNAIPEPVGDLTQVPGENGAVSMGLKWTNPSKSKRGEDLDVLSYIKIFKDQRDSVVITDSVMPGAKMTWTDPNPSNGKHTYSVVVANTTGESDRATVNTFVGIDKPGAPQELSADYDADGDVITLEWDAPEFGQYGGWFDKTGLSYRIVRQPGNKVIANNLTETTFEDEDLDEYGNYVYQVTSRTSSSLGATATTEGVVAGNSASLPIRQNWEDTNANAAWKIVDNNNDGSTLVINAANGNNEPTCVAWEFISKNVGKDKDETLYSPPVELEAGKKYRLTFYVRSNPYSSFSLNVAYGKDTTMASQTNTIVNYADVTTGGGYAPSETEFEVDESGRYYFSWWLHDTPSGYMYFDDFRIEEILDKNIEATSVRNLNTAPTAGDQISTGVTYTNTGTSRSSRFTVQLIDDDDNVLGEQTISRPIAAGASGTANITWTVPDVLGQFGVRGKVVMDGDECANDNTTNPSYLNVQAAGTRAVTIGTSTDVSEYVPFAHYGYTMCQSIYHAEDFQGMAGNIDSLSFKVRFGMERDFKDVPVQIYLANTDQNDTYTGWISSYSFTKVFDGTLDYDRGVYDFTIPFDQPFSYTGGNLCLMVVGKNDATLFLSQGNGMGAYVTEYGLGATRKWPSENYNEPDITSLDQTIGSFYSYVPNAVFYFNPKNCGSIKGTVKDGDGNPLEGVTVNPSYYRNLTATTDKDGAYFLKYVPSGYAMMQSTTKGYQNGSGYGSLTAGDTLTIDLTMQKAEVIKLIGTVTSGADNTTPIAGATVSISGDTEGSAVTDAEGNYSIDSVYSGRPYTFIVEADDYKSINYSSMQFRSYSGDGTYTYNVQLQPNTASPYTVDAIDKGETAVVSWKEPIENVTITKGGDDAYGQFGGAYDMAIGQRFSPAELQTLGADSLYYVKAIRFVPMCTSSFQVSIWQGESGNEGKVYDETITPTSFGQWNEISLQHPYKIDPTKSLVVGITVSALTGAYPVSFDRGPAVEGGDVLWDSYYNRWTTARQEVSTMNYNWALQAILGNDNNAAPVAWATTANANAPEKVVRFGNELTIDSVAKMNMNAPEAKAEETHFQLMTLDQPIARVKAKAPVHHEVKGYYVYRLEPGQESRSWNWTKLTPNAITETSFTDSTWSSLENKPYRYAVRSFYGKPYQWGDGTTSDPTFSDGVDKGHYATVTVKVNTDKGDALGARVRLTGDDKAVEKKVESADGTVTFDNVRFTDYAVQVLKPYYNRFNGTLTVDSSEVADTALITFVAKAPVNFNAVDYIHDARLSWETPSSATTGTLTWVQSDYANAYAFQEGTEYIVGQKFWGSSAPYASVYYSFGDYDYDDFYIDSIKWYASAATTYSPVIWGGLDDEEVQLFRQDYTVSQDEVGTWVGIRLDEPIKINPRYSYFIGYAATASSGQYPFAIDGGPYQYGGSWMYMYSQRNFRYCWSYVSNYGNYMVEAHVTDTPDPSKAVNEDVKFNVWRLKAADADSTSAWTKLTATPVDNENYADQTWESQPDDSYKYAVEAVYDNNAASAPVLSKTLNKGKVALLTANVTTNNGLSAAGATVTVYRGSDTFRGVVGADGQALIPEIPQGAGYEILIKKEGYDSIDVMTAIREAEFTQNYQLKEKKVAPVLVQAEAAPDNSSVSITWRKPGAYAPREGWAYWDNNDPIGGFGTSSGYCAVGQLFNPEDQTAKGMKELDITKISFYNALTSSEPSEGATWTVNIWRQTNDGFEEVLTQDVPNAVVGAWDEVTLDNPYHVSGDETLLIGYTFRGTGSCMGIDGGPCVVNKADWANFGSGWTTLHSAVSNFNYNIAIHAYLENASATTTNAPALSAPQPVSNEPLKAKLRIRHSAKKAQGAPAHEQTASFEYPVKGYLVYRFVWGKDSDQRAWTLLTQQPVQETEFTDYTWGQVEEGNYYRWAVKAVYASGQSDAVLSDALATNGTNGINTVSTGKVKITALGQGLYSVYTPQATELNVTSTSGKLVERISLKQGDNTVQLNAPKGVYIFNVTGNGVSHTEKVRK